MWCVLAYDCVHVRACRYGRLRLRFSISWHNPASRVLQYPSVMSGESAPDVLPLVIIYKQNTRAWTRCALCDTTPRGSGEPGGSGRGECVRNAIDNRTSHRRPRTRHRRPQSYARV